MTINGRVGYGPPLAMRAQSFGLGSFGEEPQVDPNETLKNLRSLCESLDWGDLEGDALQIEIDSLYAIADMAIALDDWLSKGGFLPTAWER